jgi:hypothetical protein
MEMSETETMTFVAVPAIVQRVAKACYDDPDARREADKTDLPEFEDSDENVQQFWRFIARAALEASAHRELYEGLKEAVGLLGNHAVHEDDIPPLEAALAKARGDTPKEEEAGNG